jgi:uncharacterized protein
VTGRLRRKLLIVGGGLLLALGASPAASAAFVASGGAEVPSTSVVISQFQVAGGTAADEFIELHNVSGADVPIGGWRLVYRSATGTSDGAITTFGSTASIPAGGYLLVASTTTTGGGYDGSVPADVTFNVGSTGQFAAAGGGFALYNASAATVDSVGYGTATNAFVETAATTAPAANASKARLNSGCQDTDNNSTDFETVNPSAPRNAVTTPHLCGPIVDNPPTVQSHTPTNGATGVPVNTNITITFSEPVTVSPSGSWFQVFCGPASAETVYPATVSGGPTTYTLDPTTDLDSSASCGVTVQGTQLFDHDPPPHNMVGVYQFFFTTAAPVVPVEIHQVQGATHVSPYAGMLVTLTPAIVTAVRSNGFFLQDPSPDTDFATSEAIFVFTDAAPTAAVGDLVTVTGTVTEFRAGGASSTNLTLTEISTTNPNVTRHTGGNDLPGVTVVGAGGRVPPTNVIEDDAAGSVEASGPVFDPATDGIDFYESLEGMRLQVNNPVVVGPTNGFGELWVLADDGAAASLRTARGGIMIRDLGAEPAGDYRSGDFNPERIQLDDAIADTPDANVGDHFTAPVIGVLNYDFGNFELLVTSAPAVVSGGLTREMTPTNAETELSVATFNVENLHPLSPPTKFAELAGLIVNNLKSPDVIGLEEVQDNNGPTNDSTTDANLTLTALIAAIAAAGGPTYEYRQINPVDDQDGGEPGGNIRVAFLFRTDRGVQFVDRPGGGSTTATTVVSGPSGPELSASPGRVNPTDTAWNSSRKPLAGEFLFRGEKYFVIVNHFNSKGGDQPLFGRFQPPTRTTETQRLQQAQELNDFVDSILGVDPNANVIALGDFNDFEFSLVMQTLTGDVLNSLVTTLPANERYGYVFDGNSQTLDHILVSDNILVSTPLAYDIVHVNAEFASQASDHDPSVVRLLDQARLALTKVAGPPTVEEGDNVTYTLTVTNSGPKPATNVTITDSLPASAEFVAVTQSQGTCGGTTTVVCNVGTLANGGSAAVVITVRMTQDGTVTNTASVAADQGDPDMTNNVASAATTVEEPDDAPTVTSTTPTDGATGVSESSNITITFSESVNAAAGAFTLVCSPGGSHAFSITPATGPSTTFTLNPADHLPRSSTCTVGVEADNVTDADADDPPDNMATDYAFSFSTPPPDAAPTVASTTPGNGTTGVARNADVTITFSEPVTAAASDGTFQILCTISGAHAYTRSGGPTTYTLNPTTDFAISEDCTVTVAAAGISDTDADDPPDAMAADHAFTFHTVDAAPTVTATSPLNGASNVPAGANITVTFSESVNAGPASFSISCSPGGNQTFDQSPAGPATAYTLNPLFDLPRGAACTVTVHGAFVTDADADDPPDTMAADHTFNFTTPPPDAAPAVTSTSPANGATNVPVDANVTVTFSEPVTAPASAFSISCGTSGAHPFAISGGPTTFTLNPNINFLDSETCTVTVSASGVADEDADDPPNGMAADHVFSFATQTPIPIGTVHGPISNTTDGATHRSPFAPTPTNPSNPCGTNTAGTTTVLIRGVIYQKTLARTSAGANQHGFFIQNTEATRDADPNTSDGIFVFLGNFTTLIGGYTPVVGHEVVLSARVTEFNCLTQLTSASLVRQARTGVVVDAELPPFEANPPDFTDDANRYWERREGMRGRAPVGSITVGRRQVFGPTTTMDGEDAFIAPTHPVALRANEYARRTFRDPHPLDNRPELWDDGNGFRIILGSMGVKSAANDNTALIAPARTFDRIAVSPAGGLYFSFAKYIIHPEQQITLTPGADPSQNNPPTAPRGDEYSIADYNVENLYDYRDDPFDGCDFTGNTGCPGVNPPFDYVPVSQAFYDEKLRDIAQQIVEDLHSPHIIMTQEGEDQDICTVTGTTLTCGTTNNADGRPDSLQELALAIRARGGPVYDAVYDRDGADARGIVSAFMYRTDRVALVGAQASHPVLGSSPTVSYRGAPLAYNTQVQNPKVLNAVLPADVDRSTGTDPATNPNVFTRAPQVGLFRIWELPGRTGNSFDVYGISNHFSSTPQSRVGQRREQARYNAAIVAAIQASEPNARVDSAGDFNVFPRPDDPFMPGQPLYPTDQLAPLYEAGLLNLWDVVATEAPENSYSYVFDMNAQTLDMHFVTPSMRSDLRQFRMAHLNADYPTEFDSPGARGLSDHDPGVARFAAPAALAGVGLSKVASSDRAAEGSVITYTLTVTNNGPSNATDVVVTDPLPSGLSLISISTTQGTCTQGPPIRCSLGTMGTGVAARIVIDARATQPGEVTNEATVTLSTQDPSAADNTARARTVVEPATFEPPPVERGCRVSASPGSVRAGRRAAVTISVARLSPREPVANTVVRLRGAGVDRAVRTGGSGTVRVTIRPARAGRIQVTAPQLANCAASIRVQPRVRSGVGPGLTGRPGS